MNAECKMGGMGGGRLGRANLEDPVLPQAFALLQCSQTACACQPHQQHYAHPAAHLYAEAVALGDVRHPGGRRHAAHPLCGAVAGGLHLLPAAGGAVLGIDDRHHGGNPVLLDLHMQPSWVATVGCGAGTRQMSATFEPPAVMPPQQDDPNAI